MDDRPRRPTIALRLHGEPTCDLDGAVRVLEPRAAALLALVAVEGEVTRERAAALLWPESADPRGALRQQLARFRRLAGIDLLEGADPLRLAAGVATDVTEPPPPTAAAAAPLLGDLRFPDQPAFDAWLMRQRARAPAPRAAADRPAVASDDGAGAASTTGATRAAGVDVPLPATLLRPPRLVGRAAEQAALAEAWASGRALLLLGEAGLGKSRLLAEFAQGRRVLMVAGRPGDAGVPYATLTRLLRLLMQRCTFALPDPQRQELARLLPEIAPGAAPPAEGQRLALQAALERLLADARLDQAALEGLIVDDLHFADEASIEMLQSLVGALAATLRFAFAQRPGEGSAASEALRDALEEGGLLGTQPIAPLTEPALRELLDSLQIDDLDAARLAGALARHSGGNPLFALETLKQGLAGGALRAGRLPQPQSVEALIERRLQRLSGPAIGLARVAAIAGPDFDPPLAEHALGVRAIALADAWTELQQAQVLRDNGFAHDLVADAVLRAVPAALARHLHGQVARWLAQHEGEPARIARHWEAAGETARAAAAWEEAARFAQQRVRSREAMLAYDRAADLHATLGDARTSFRLRLAAVDEAALLDLPLAQYRAQAARLVELAWDDATRCQALPYLVRADEIAGDSAALARNAQAMLASARAAGLRSQEAIALIALGTSQVNHGQHAAALDSFRQVAAIGAEIGDPETEGLGHSAAGVTLIKLGRSDETLAAFERARPLYARLPSALRLLMLEQQTAIVLSGRGQAAAALAAADRALALAERFEPSGDMKIHLWVARAMALRQLGHYAQALAQLEPHVADMAVTGTWALGRLHLELVALYTDLGRADRARRHLAAAQAVSGGPVAERHRAQVAQLRLCALTADRTAALLPLDAAAEPRRQCEALRALADLTPAPRRAALLADALAQATAARLDDEACAAALLLAREEAAAGALEAALARARAALPPADRIPAGYPPAVWLAAAEVFTLAGQAEPAGELLQRALGWLRGALAGLPVELRASLRERVDVNRRLLQAARRDPRLAAASASLAEPDRS